jgi:predicted phosphodiesterase
VSCMQVGDIHGCYDALLELLRKVQYQPRHDNLILVGDLVNKGPKSQQVCHCRTLVTY